MDEPIQYMKQRIRESGFCALRIFIFIVAVSLFFGAVAHAAAPLLWSFDAVFSLTSPAVDFTVKSGSVADSLSVNATSVVVTLSNSTGGSFVLTSATSGLSVSHSG